jgi:YHS domain-containing protein
MRFLLRVVGMLIVIWAGLSIVRRLFGAIAPSGQVQNPTAAAAGHLVKDPVCGTYVPQATALHIGNVFFCSETCRHKFQINAG